MPTIFGKPRVYAIWHFGDVMAALPRTRPPLQRPDRRSFLWSLASLGFPSGIPKPEKLSEQVYRFLTPVCEVRMSVQYFASSSTSSFRFRDDLTNRTFCLSANGEQTGIVWSGSSAQWLLPSIIFARGVTPGLRATCGSAC